MHANELSIIRNLPYPEYFWDSFEIRIMESRLYLKNVGKSNSLPVEKENFFKIFPFSGSGKYIPFQSFKIEISPIYFRSNDSLSAAP